MKLIWLDWIFINHYSNLSLGADEVVCLSFRKADPALAAGVNGSGSHCRNAVLLPGAVTRSPLLIAQGLTADPEPEAEHAGVTETQPHVSGGGHRGHVLHPKLDLLRVHRHQVHVFISAVSQSSCPRQILSDQNQFICNTNRSRNKNGHYSQTIHYDFCLYILIFTAY